MSTRNGEKEGWVTAHGSTARVITPYDNIIAIMHEGASGGGKGEMIEKIHREMDGKILLSTHTETKEKTYLALKEPCVHPQEPLIFLNHETVPLSTCLIWVHAMDAPGKHCPNPRVIMPRRLIPNIVNEPVEVDIRSFTVRTPPTGLSVCSICCLPPLHGYGHWLLQEGWLTRPIFCLSRLLTFLVPNQHIGIFKIGFMLHPMDSKKVPLKMRKCKIPATSTETLQKSAAWVFS